MTSVMSRSMERDNFSRLGQGVVHVGSSMTRDTLEKYIPSSSLSTIVTPTHPVWNKLNKDQQKLVKNSGRDGYTDFDITLCYTLLRNVCTNLNSPNKLASPVGGWGVDPLLYNTTISDDIERLRLLRNTVHGHRAQATIPEAEYMGHWKLLKDICSRMQTHLNKQYLAELTSLERYTLSELEMKELIDELGEIKIEIKQISKPTDASATSDELKKEIKDIKEGVKDIKEEMKQKSRPTDASEIRDEEIQQLHRFLRKVNHDETERVLLAPLDPSSILPIDSIFAPVTIRKDLEDTHKQQDLAGEKKSVVERVNGPDDIFLKNGEPTRLVVMQGEAGRGKSVYCLQLMKKWCNVKQADQTDELNDWEKQLDKFDFLFSVMLRDIKKNIVIVTKILFSDLQLKGYSGCEETISHILSSNKHRCLVIIDGLDEWTVSDELKSELTFSCLPTIENIISTTFFITMRPWKFQPLARHIRNNDRVLEIQGLDDDGIQTVIRNVLVNHFDIQESSADYQGHFKNITEKMNDMKFKSLLQVPLLAVVSVILWFKKKNVGNCMTTFYIALVRMLIERAFENKTVEEEIIKKLKKWKKDDLTIPPILQRDNILNDFIDVLLPLGEIAFADLTSKETRLVFEKREIEKMLGESELDFVLKVGLLTQSNASGSIHAKEVSINFFHKTVQEFLTAMYVSSMKEVSVQYLEHLSTIEVIMEFDNVNMFVSGLSPSLGEILSHHIVKVANTDSDICKYRETFHYKLFNKVNLLYNMQLSCLREIKETEKDVSQTAQHDYHISDVYIDDDSDTDIVRMTADVLCNHNINVKSLYIFRVPIDRQHGVTDDVINTFLQQTTTLQSLYISGYKNNKRTLHNINTVTSLKALVLVNLRITTSLLHDIQTTLHNNTHIQCLGLVGVKCVDSELKQTAASASKKRKPTLTTSFCSLLQNLPSCKHLSELHISYMLNREEREMFVNVLPRLSQLKVIMYYGSTRYRGVDDGEYDYTIAHMVSQWTQLRELTLGYITLGDRPLELPVDMDHIEEVRLRLVKVSAEGWGKLITSLINIQHQFDVRLWDTDISDDCVTMIRSSPHFTGTRHDVGKSELWCTRKFPPKQQTQEEEEEEEEEKDDDDDDDDDAGKSQKHSDDTTDAIQSP